MPFDPIRGEFTVGHHQTALGVHHGLRVETLLAVADRQRHVNRRQTERGQFGDRSGTGTTDDQIGAGEGEIDAFQIRGHTVIAIGGMLRPQFAKSPLPRAHGHQGTHLIVLAFAGQVNHLRVLQQFLGGSGHGTIHVHRAQRSSGDHHQRTIRINTESRRGRAPRRHPITFQIRGELRDRRPQWQSHAFDLDALARFQPRFRIGGPDHGGPTCAQLVRHAGACVLLMNRNRNAQLVGRRVHRCRGVAAETDDHLRLVACQNIADLARLGLPFCRKLQRGLVESAGKRHLFDGFQQEAGLRNQIMFQTDGGAHHRDVRIRLLLPNHMRHRKQRIDMAGGAAARQNDMLLITHSQRA